MSQVGLAIGLEPACPMMKFMARTSTQPGAPGASGPVSPPLKLREEILKVILQLRPQVRLEGHVCAGKDLLEGVGLQTSHLHVIHQIQGSSAKRYQVEAPENQRAPFACCGAWPFANYSLCLRRRAHCPLPSAAGMILLLRSSRAFSKSLCRSQPAPLQQQDLDQCTVPRGLFLH